MATAMLSNLSLPPNLTDLLAVAQPKSYADIAALLALAAGSAGLLYKPWDRPDPYNYLWFEKPQLKDGQNLQRAKETRNIAKRLEESNKQGVIFWGSQSGTAEAFALRLARECHLRFGLELIPADLSDYDPETIALIPSSKLAVFIMSTFGEGDPSDNAAGFWEYIQKNPTESFESVQYAAFGLGNRNYQHYNRVIDIVVAQLDKLGARAMMPVGRADDAEGQTEEHFMEWKDSFLHLLQTDLGLEEKETRYLPELEVVEDDSLDIIDLHQGAPVQRNTNTAQSPPVLLPVTASRELFEEKERNCVHMELNLADAPKHSYKTGDHLAVWPSNPNEEVERLLTVLGLKGRRDVPISIKSVDPAVKVDIPTPTSTEVLFRHYLEICAAVSRDTILALLQFAPTPEIRSFLETLAKDRAAYAAFVGQNHLTLGRLLELAVTLQGSAAENSWSNIPLSFVVESLSTLRPRLYSISSSSIVSPRSIHLTALVTKTALPTNSDTSIAGLASNYLHALTLSANGEVPQPSSPTYQLLPADPHPTLYASIRKSKFRPPPPNTPIIMVAAGTGLAPFRAFLLERSRLHSMGRPVGQAILFFGCRKPDEDFIYREELTSTVSKLPSAELVTCFSRKEYEGKAGRGYVQDAVAARGEELCRLVFEQGARVFVCGRAGMSREVAAQLKEATSQYKAWDEAEVGSWWDGWRKSGGFVEDVWG